MTNRDKRPIQLDDRKWLKETYRTHDISQIAEICGCGSSTVWRALKRLGIKARVAGVPRIDKLHDYEWVKENYPSRTMAEIAQELNCGIGTVDRAIDRLGLQWDKRVLFPPLEDAVSLKRRYDEIGAVKLAGEIGCSTAAVHSALRRRNIARHGRGASKKIIALWNADLLRELSEKHTVREIAKIFNCSDGAVRVAFGRYGLMTTNGTIPKPRPVLRYHSENKPNGKSAVIEHRLIMEQYLGRKLSNKEHVHHKDLNPLNNSIDNLLVLSHVEHISLHHSDRKIPYTCVTCGVEEIGGSWSKKYCYPCGETRKKTVNKERYIKHTSPDPLGAH